MSFLRPQAWDGRCYLGPCPLLPAASQPIPYHQPRRMIQSDEVERISAMGKSGRLEWGAFQGIMVVLGCAANPQASQPRFNTTFR
ncbi:hypothetical protein BDW62DRAFT_183915 [Aspergillus aurantiobrunneus]